MTDEMLKCPTKDPSFVGQNVQRVTKSFREACFCTCLSVPFFWPYSTLKVGCLWATIALHRNGVLVSGNSVGKQCCTSSALLGWVVWKRWALPVDMGMQLSHISTFESDN